MTLGTEEGPSQGVESAVLTISPGRLAKTPCAVPAHQVLTMPALSPTMTAGSISAWKKQEGEKVEQGDVLADIETDKATMEMESMEEGYLAKIILPEGSQNVNVGVPVAILCEEEEAVSAFSDYTPSDADTSSSPSKSQKKAPQEESKVPEGKAAEPAEAKSPPPPASVASPAKPRPAAAPKPADGSRILASPLARRIARELGTSLEGMVGTGPGGRIVAIDVHEQAVPSAEASTASAMAAAYPEYVDIPNTTVRKITAARLLESKQTIPHYYLSIECNVEELMKLRTQLNETLAASDGGKLSVNDFVVKASALALRKVPECNASWNEDYIRQYKEANINVAVQTEHGLMVPVIPKVCGKGLATISTEVKALASKAKEGKLTPEDFSGGTFTISNLGMFGIKQFCAIVNPPQACILAVGGAYPKVVSLGGDSYAERKHMTVTLSCDHRVVDGAVGAQWLQAFKGYVENPLTMIL